MKLLSTLLFSVLLIGSFAAKASACMMPTTTGEDVHRVHETRTTTLVHPSKRTLVNQMRAMRRHLPTTVKGF